MITRRRFNQVGAAAFAALAVPSAKRARAGGTTGQPAGLRAGASERVGLAGVARGAARDEVVAAVNRAAEAATDFSWLSRGDTVLIKPVCNSGNAYPATTDPVALHAMIRLLQKKGAGRVIVGDMSGVQFVRFQKDSLSGSTRALMEQAGMLQAAQEAGAEVVAFEEEGWDAFAPEQPRVGPDWKGEILMPAVVGRADHIVLMPRCARHVLAGSTLGLKAAVGWWRTDSRLEYHHDAATLSRKTAEANSVPSLVDKQRLVLSSATKVLSTFGPDQGFIAEPEVGLVYASTSVTAHDMVSLAWLIDNQQQATPRDSREGILNDPNQSDLLVNLINRGVTLVLGGGLRGFFSAETLERYDLDTIWDDRVLAEAFRMQSGAPRLELEATGAFVPADVLARLVAATEPA